MNHQTEARQLSAVGRLLGRLVVREIDQDLLAELSVPALKESLDGLGLDVPSPTSLDHLAAEFFETVLHPKNHPPLVQSVCEEGRYEGTTTDSVRTIAEQAGVDLDSDLARGAPPDQLGVELLLWAELVERSNSSAEFAERHLAWAQHPLERIATADGFYGRLAEVVRGFVEVITEREAMPDRSLEAPGDRVGRCGHVGDETSRQSKSRKK